MRLIRLATLVIPLTFVAGITTWAATQPAASPVPAVAISVARATLANSRYMDVGGHVVTLGQSSPKAMAFVFLNTECPIANKLVPEMNRLAELAGKNHVEFYGVLSDPSVTRAEGAKHSADFKITFPVIFDASGTLAGALEPKVTPHAFVVDVKGKVLYSGRIDDSYAGVGKEKAVTTTHDLQDAIAAGGAGKEPKVGFTEAVGCIFESWKRVEKDGKKPAVTWSRDIAPIVYANCATCHHDGEVAPFSLMSYKDAAKRADMLAAVTESKQMPPWKASDPWGTFHDERRLTEAQIALMQAWAAAGAPEGDAKDAPAAPKFADTWQLQAETGQKPDLIVKMPKAFEIPANSRDIMAFTVIPLNIPEDKYAVAFEYRPGNRKVVHHMIAYLDSNGAARELAKTKGDGMTYTSFGGPGFTPTGALGGWAPGAEPRFLPEGVGHPVKKGSDLVLNIHYHPTGKAEKDQGEVAIYFAKKPVQQVGINIPLRNRDIDIKPGDNNYVRTATITTPIDVTLRGITPHMHMLGREMKVTATFPDGHKQQLIYVNDWDWNWQGQYTLATPIKLTAGTTVDMWARYDNSKENPRNPQNPPKRVTYGEQTTNEMCIAFLELTVDGLRAPLLGAAAGDGAGGAIGNDPTAGATLRERLKELRQERGVGTP